MAGTNNPEHPIPMLDTAESIVDTDERLEPFVLSLFPNASQDQMAMMKLYAIGWFMEGEEMGRILAKHGATDDIPQPEAYVPEVSEEPYNLSQHISILPTFCPHKDMEL